MPPPAPVLGQAIVTATAPPRSCTWEKRGERPPLICLQLLGAAQSRSAGSKQGKAKERIASAPNPSAYQPGLLPETHSVLLQDDNPANKAGKPEPHVGARKRAEQEHLGETKNGAGPPRHTVGLPRQQCQPHRGTVGHGSA